MAKLAIKGDLERGNEIIEILEMLGGKNTQDYIGTNKDSFYFIDDDNVIDFYYLDIPTNYTIFTLEEFLEKYPYKVGDEVIIKKKNQIATVEMITWCCDTITYWLKYGGYIEGNWRAEHLEPCKEEIVKVDIGNISDGYHTFNELYEYRLLYNASLFNEWAKQGLYDVHKSRRHSDGSIPFDDENWFIVQAELPTGQISNHYEMKDWNLFDIPIKDKTNPYDGHTPQDVAKRLRKFLTPKSKYPTNYEECCKVLGLGSYFEPEIRNTTTKECNEMMKFMRLKRCRDAYWKLYGEKMELGKPWEPDWKNGKLVKHLIYTYEGVIQKRSLYSTNAILVFPTVEMRGAFYDNFKDLIEDCKELL